MCVDGLGLREVGLESAWSRLGVGLESAWSRVEDVWQNVKKFKFTTGGRIVHDSGDSASRVAVGREVVYV